MRFLEVSSAIILDKSFRKNNTSNTSIIKLSECEHVQHITSANIVGIDKNKNSIDFLGDIDLCDSLRVGSNYKIYWEGENLSDDIYVRQIKKIDLIK